MKKKIFKVSIVVALIGLFICFIPFPKEISYQGTEVEYSLNDETIAIPHEVVIEGTYYTSLLAKDRFYGKLYISDIGGLEEDMTVDFRFNPRYRYQPVFLNWAGEPHLTSVGEMFFSRNFEILAIQLAVKYEERDNGSSVSFGDRQSNFIVLGADTYDEALKIYNAQLTKKMG